MSWNPSCWRSTLEKDPQIKNTPEVFAMPSAPRPRPAANVIDSAANPMDPLKAASEFRAWLLKEKSAFRSFLFILAGNNTYYTGHTAESSWLVQR